MTSALLLVALALPAAAKDPSDLGGHVQDKELIAEPAPADARKADLEEMWLRRLLPPDQTNSSPSDRELLQKIRAGENDATEFLKKRFGTARAYQAKTRPVGSYPRYLLTKDGYEKYVFLLTQDAIDYFESKGADVKRVFKLLDWDGKPMFDGKGLLTPEGAHVYRRAKLNLETFWKSPAGDAYGTRRPPTKSP